MSEMKVEIRVLSASSFICHARLQWCSVQRVHHK